MRTIGLLGGMSWESSAEYYRIINQAVNRRLGGVHSAKVVMVSVDFAEIEAHQHAGAWDEAARVLVDAAQQLEAAGAACVVLCTNTMHKLAEQLEHGTDLPLLHIADPTARAIQAEGIERVALLGTTFTMEQDFYAGRLRDAFGLDVMLPHPPDRDIVHRVIYEELVRGELREESRREYGRILSNMAERGARGAILGCTEIGLLITQADSPIPVFDTTELHALAAVDFALA
jgi:aspartate racemase